ncbi:unnamed protein product [Prunus armeniaca]|uniref:UBA domain-containing protein n=1 Tax=Prunus armeniaca TaxID=36596 RepID=A0A6J5WQL2_PRUAR|nr:unnamed protein product [Prunus armeniaca]
MDYDYRTRSGSPYDSHVYRPATSSAPSSHPMYGPPSSSSMYPRVGQQGQTAAPPPYAHSGRPLSHHQTTTPSSSSSCKFRIGHSSYYKTRVSDHSSAYFSFQVGDIPRSSFQFDFDFERKVLAELEKETQNWAKLGLENPPQRPVESPSSSGSVADPIVSKYIASGLSREAVPIAVANYGDNPTKVREFAKSFTQLREMGFAPNDVAEALIMYENDTDKAVAHFLNSSS